MRRRLVQVAVEVEESLDKLSVRLERLLGRVETLLDEHTEKPEEPQSGDDR